MNISKRSVYAMSLLATAIGLASCGGKKEKAFHPQVEPAAPKVLTIYSWSDYFDLEVFAAFEQKTGIKIDYKVFEDTDEMVAKLRSEPGKYDVIVADDSIINSVAELRLIQPLDHKLVPNLANIDPEHLDYPFDPKNKYSAPVPCGERLWSPIVRIRSLTRNKVGTCSGILL